MNLNRNLIINGRQNSLSSINSSSVESLSSSHGTDSFDQELTISRLRTTETSDYDTSAAEHSEDMKHSKKSGKVRKVSSLSFDHYIISKFSLLFKLL